MVPVGLIHPGVNMLPTRQDLFQAARQIRNAPLASASAILSLGLAMGAIGAVVSVMDALVWRKLAVAHPEQLVRVAMVRPDGRETALSVDGFRQLQAGVRSMSAVIGWTETSAVVDTASGTIRGSLLLVTDNFLRELGVVPSLGRPPGGNGGELFTATPEAMISHTLWQRDFGGRTSILGEVVRIKGVPMTLVGVAPRGFTGLSVLNEPAVIVPVSMLPSVTGRTTAQLSDPNAFWLSVVGRLRPGYSEQVAESELQGIATPRESQDTARTMPRVHLSSASRGHEPYARARFGPSLVAMLTIASLIAAIAMVNVAVLVLARAMHRQDEWRIRLALGGERRAFVRQGIAEAVTLVALATAIAAWCATVGSDTLIRLFIGSMAVDPRPDIPSGQWMWLVLLSTGALTTILVGLVPAWLATGSQSLRVSKVRRGLPTSSRVLIVAQMALSVAVLSAAVLLGRSLWNLRTIDTGYRSANVVVANLAPRAAGYQGVDGASYFSGLLDRVRALPGVTAAAVSHYAPGSGGRHAEPVQTIEESVTVDANVALVSREFFDVVGLARVAGEAFESEGTTKPAVALVSESLARTLFGERPASGQSIRLGAGAASQLLRVVGVVKDAQLYDLRDPSRYTVYRPHLQAGGVGFYNVLLIKTETGHSVTRASISDVVRSMGVEDVTWVKSLGDLQRETIIQELVAAAVTAGFAAIAVVLSAVGVFGLLAYAAAVRRGEFGVRIALGATPRRVVWAAVRETCGLSIAGAAVGVIMAMGMSQMIAAVLVGLSPTDATTLAMSAACLVLTSVVAAICASLPACTTSPADSLRL